MSQETLNTPLADPTGLSQQNQKFLKMVMDLIKKKKIDLHNPETLINHKIYDKLPKKQQGKTDLEAVNLLAAIREIKDLYDGGFTKSYQMHNVVDRVRDTKERLEIKKGDVFII